MREFAYFIYSKLKGKLPVEDEIKDLGGVGHRYALYKVSLVEFESDEVYTYSFAFPFIGRTRHIRESWDGFWFNRDFVT